MPKDNKKILSADDYLKPRAYNTTYEFIANTARSKPDSLDEMDTKYKSIVSKTPRKIETIKEESMDFIFDRYCKEAEGMGLSLKEMEEHMIDIYEVSACKIWFEKKRIEMDQIIKNIPYKIGEYFYMRSRDICKEEDLESHIKHGNVKIFELAGYEKFCDKVVLEFFHKEINRDRDTCVPLSVIKTRNRSFHNKLRIGYNSEDYKRLRPVKKEFVDKCSHSHPRTNIFV